jgi:hypothetical protein
MYRMGLDRHRFGKGLHGLVRIFMVWIGSSWIWVVFSGEWIVGLHWNGQVVFVGQDSDFSTGQALQILVLQIYWMLIYISTGSEVKRNR